MSRCEFWSSERHSLTVEGMTYRGMRYQGVFVIYLPTYEPDATLLLSCDSSVLPVTIDRTHPLRPLLGTESHHLGSLT